MKEQLRLPGVNSQAFPLSEDLVAYANDEGFWHKLARGDALEKLESKKIENEASEGE